MRFSLVLTGLLLSGSSVWSQGSGSILDHVPGDALVFSMVRPGPFLASKGGKILYDLAAKSPKNDLKALLEKIGIGIREVEAVVVVVPKFNFMESDPGKEMYMLLSTSKAINAGELEAGLTAKDGEKKEVGGKTFVVRKKTNEAFHLAHPKLLVIGTSKGVLESFPKAKGSEGALSNALKEASEKPTLMFTGFQVPADLTAMVKKSAPPQAAGFLPILDAQQGQVTLREESGLSLQLKLQYPDADKTQKAKVVVDGLTALGRLGLPAVKKEFPPGTEAFYGLVKQALDSVKSTTDGVHVVVTAQIDKKLDDLGELMGPVIAKMREAATRTQALNNLRQLGLAMHNYHDVFNCLPLAKVGGGLSWRVELLPFVEEDPLYRQFKKNESWDSPHNKKLLERMPSVFVHPSRPAPPGHTYFQVFTGPKTLFDGEKVRFAQVTDGLSNTILLVEAAEAVPWTKPADLVVGNGPLPKLGNADGQFLAVFGDGSVRVLSVTGDRLRALITRNGNETDTGK